jgi:hypothetical protein
MNFTQHKLFIGAMKSGVASVTGVVLANVVDVQNPIFSLAWLKHIGIASFFVLVVTEARYWNQWANSGGDQSLPVAIDQAKVAAEKTKDAIAKVEAIAPEATKTVEK